MGANAGTAVPTYAIGDVLTAANLNLTNAGVPVFATTTTRDGAFGTGKKTLAEGQVCYIEAAPKRFQVYNGTAWVDYQIESTTYTPTITSFTLGNGTSTWAYTQFGKQVFVRGAIVFGSTTSITGTPSVTYPITAASFYGSQSYFGNVFILDSGTAAYSGFCVALSTSAFEITATNASGTYATQTAINATVPMTWAVNDAIRVSFVYEAA